MPKRWIVLLLGFACAAGAAELPHNWGFEANGGQSDPAVRFLQRGSRYALFLTAEGAVLKWNDAVPSVLRMKFVSANPTPRTSGQDALPARNSFFIGSDAGRWVKDVPVFAKVRYERLYPGIDLLFYNGSQGIEYDFEIAPYARPDQIRIRFDEAARAGMDPEGNLSVGPPGGSVRIGRPAAYQMGTDHRRRAVFAEFARKGGDIGLKIG